MSSTRVAHKHMVRVCSHGHLTADYPIRCLLPSTTVKSSVGGEAQEPLPFPQWGTDGPDLKLVITAALSSRVQQPFHTQESPSLLPLPCFLSLGEGNIDAPWMSTY